MDEVLALVLVDGFHVDQVLALVLVHGFHVDPLDRLEVLLLVPQVSEPTKIFFWVFNNLSTQTDIKSSYYGSSDCLIVYKIVTDLRRIVLKMYIKLTLKSSRFSKSITCVKI